MLHDYEMSFPFLKSLYNTVTTVSSRTASPVYWHFIHFNKYLVCSFPR